MEKLEEYSVEFMERCTYRVLQQVAKSLKLPSNVKKIYLIQLIYAKKNCSEAEVNNIVERVKAERQKLSQTNNRRKTAKRMRLQAAEISSTNNTGSPPIDLTPKRAGLVTSSPIQRYRQNILNSFRTYTTSQSDRVLRSFNLRTYKKPNYSLLNDSFMDLLKYPRRPEAKISIISRETKNPNLNMTTRCVVRKYRPSLFKTENRSLVPVNRNLMTLSPLPTRRQQRALSGIYPLCTQQPTTKSGFDCIQSIGYRRNDGKFSKINALVQRNALNSINMEYNSKNTNNYTQIYPAIDYAIPESMSKSISTLSERLLKNYPNMSITKDVDLTDSDDEALNLVKLKNKYTNTEYLRSTYDNNTNNLDTQIIDSSTPEQNKNIDHLYTKTTVIMVTSSNQTQESQSQMIPKEYERPKSNGSVTESTLSRITNISDLNQYQTNEVNQQSNVSSSTTSSESSSIDFSTNSSMQNSMVKSLNFTDSPVTDDDPIILNPSEQYTKMSALTDVIPPTKNINIYNAQNNNDSGYYHKKIRADKVRCQRLSCQRAIVTHVDCSLPKINDVFTKFNDYVKDVSQPLYVQVDDGRQIQNKYSESTPKSIGSPYLEMLYTLSRSLAPALTLAPPIKVAETECVYTTPSICTAMAQPTKFNIEPTQTYPHERDSYQIVVNDQLSRKSDYLRLSEQDITLRNYQEVAPSDTSSVDQQDLNATIPEMIEDALEIMSQDGDYMDRLGMDERMQCILCSWAGPKIILENHIRKEHSNQISCEARPQWSVCVSVSHVLCQQVWVSHITEYMGRLYATSIRPHYDLIMTTIQSISSEYEPKTGSLTIYNRATGVPFTWQGTIQDISTNMPLETDSERLVVPQNQINDSHVTVIVNIFH